MFLKCCDFDGKTLYCFRVKNGNGEFFNVSDKFQVETLIASEGFFPCNPIEKPKEFIKYAISYDNSSKFFFSLEKEKTNFKNRVAKIASEIVETIISKNENYHYIHDPGHVKQVPPGYERTKSGWSKGKIKQVFSVDAIETAFNKIVSDIKPFSIQRNNSVSYNSVFRVTRDIEIKGKKKTIGTFFKPEKKGLAYRRGMNKDCTQSEREVMSYQLSKALGLNVVPPTCFSELKGKRGTEQMHVGGKGMRDLTREERSHINWYTYEKERLMKKLQKIAIFDIIAGNTDRHADNLLFDEKTKNFHAIDNGLTFPENNKGFFSNKIRDPYSGSGNNLRSCAVTLIAGYFEAEKDKNLIGKFNANSLKEAYLDGAIFFDVESQELIESIDEEKVAKLFDKNNRFNEGQKKACLERIRFLKELIK